VISNAVAAFVGCLCALIVMAETGAIASKVVRYIAALVVGALLTILVAWLLGMIAGALGRAL